MIISTCSFGSTGSSAVSDYLKEYDTLQVIDKVEFSWVVEVDSLIDLDYHINHPHFRTSDSIFAIERFMNRVKQEAPYYSYVGGIPKDLWIKYAEDFIENITQTRWAWFGVQSNSKWYKYFGRYIMANKIIPYFEKKYHKRLNWYPYKTVRLSCMPDNFSKEAKDYVEKILESLGASKDKDVVLDQAFSGNDPVAAFKFFEDPYAIVVDRDPRDNYVFGRTKLWGRNHFMSIDNVQEFVNYYKALRHNQPYKTPNERVLKIQFEDMIYNYDNTTQLIRSFLNLPDNPHPRSIFDPELSIANTQVYKRFPEFKNDIKYIEEQLPEYLYDYSDKPEPDFNSKMFSGKSPKNK